MSGVPLSNKGAKVFNDTWDRSVPIRLKKILFNEFDTIVQPDIRPIDSITYKLVEDYVFRLYGLCKVAGQKYSAQFTIIVPKGFLCDGQSVPRPLWWCMRPDGLVRAAALIHDALYRSQGGWQNPIDGGLNDGVEINILCPDIDSQDVCSFDRKTCDMLYRDIYKKSVPMSSPTRKKELRKANLGYRMLRIFGRRYFGKEMPEKG